MKETVLLTGGAGFIGSHIAVELLQRDYNVVIADDLSNARPDVPERIRQITGRAPSGSSLWWPRYLRKQSSYIPPCFRCNYLLIWFLIGVYPKLTTKSMGNLKIFLFGEKNCPVG